MSLGLVLSGGGVKGAAHIGVLKALEEEGIKISGITGTSSGSIVASLYASGYSADEIYYIFKRYCRYITDVDKTLPLKILGTMFTGKIKVKGLARGNNLECLVRNFCMRKGKTNIQDLNIPIAIPAVDIRDGRIIYYTNINKYRNNSVMRENTTIYKDVPEYVYDARICEVVRASSSVPGVFYPKVIGSHMLVDGGVRVNSPVSMLRGMLKCVNKEADKILTICFEKAHNNYIPCNLIDTTIKAYDIMGHEINYSEIEKSDYVIDVESQGVGLLDISKIDYMYKLGYTRTKEFLRVRYKEKNSK